MHRLKFYAFAITASSIDCHIIDAIIGAYMGRKGAFQIHVVSLARWLGFFRIWLHLNIVWPDLIMGSYTVFLFIEDDPVIFLTVSQLGVLRTMENRKALDRAALGIYFIDCFQGVLSIVATVTQLRKFTFWHRRVLQLRCMMEWSFTFITVTLVLDTRQSKANIGSRLVKTDAVSGLFSIRVRLS